LSEKIAVIGIRWTNPHQP